MKKDKSNLNQTTQNEIKPIQSKLDETMMDETVVQDNNQSNPRSTGSIVLNNNLNPGDRFLDEFEVIEFLGKGGAGAVYLVKRPALGDVFAAKFPIRDVMAHERTRKLFFREIRTWIGLPTHPNLTACRFIRSLDQKIIIFSEFVDGGSLAQGIIGKRLLSIAKILDVAIQMAWGLQAAHECNVVHQDVKPSNVLLSSDGTTKITDFGLSRAYQTLDDIESESNQQSPKTFRSNSQTASVSSGIMTPMFCSPEQSDRKLVDHRTDIWSWGVSVMSMFTGPTKWISGVVAASVLEGCLKRGPVEPWPAIPEPIAHILRKCFQLDPDKRWQSMKELVDSLIAVYQELVGLVYPRVTPVSIKNPEFKRQLRSVEKLRQAYKLLDRESLELEILTDITATTHQAHIIHRMELYHEVGLALREKNLRENAEIRLLFVELMLEKSELHRLIADLDGTFTITDQLISLYELIPAEMMSPADEHLQGCVYFEHGIVYMRRMLLEKANDLFLKALNIWESVANKSEIPRYWLAAANAHNARAVIFHGQGKVIDALDSQNQSIDILKMLKTRDDGIDVNLKLAGYLTNKAVFLGDLGRFDESIKLHLESVELLERLVYQEDRSELVTSLAMNLMNLANEFFTLKRYGEAIETNNKAIKLMEQVLNEQGELDVRLFLARIYMNKGNALAGLDRNTESLTEIIKGQEIIEQKIFVEGNSELVEELLGFHKNRAMTLLALHRYSEARNLLRSSEETLLKCYADRDRNTYRWLQTSILNCAAKVESEAGESDAAFQILTRCMDMLREDDVELTVNYILFFKITIWEYFTRLAEIKEPSGMIQIVEEHLKYLGTVNRSISDDDYLELVEMLRFFSIQARGELGEIEFARAEMKKFQEFIEATMKRKPEDELETVLGYIQSALEGISRS